MGKWSRIQSELEQMKANHIYRIMTEFSSAQAKSVCIEGKNQHLFSSNSYLDLCNEPDLKNYAKRIIDQFGVGSGGSRLTTGTSSIHLLLERTIADFKKREAALVFNTGFMANCGIISALAKKGDIIYSDELNHASIIDGCRLSNAKIIIYKHNDMEDLEKKIMEHKGSPGIIVSDGVFSMDGDIVALPRLVELAKRYQLLSMIDEAHATGVIGETGRGTEEYYHMEGEVDILMGTLSKAIGSEGGFVCGSKLLIDYLINTSRSFIFSTALSPVSVAASIAGIKRIEKEPERVMQLQENVRYCCRRLQDTGFHVHSETAIIPIMIYDEAKAMSVMEYLKEHGYYVSAIRYPTVSKNSARLRIALMSSHSKEEIDELVELLKKATAFLQ